MANPCSADFVELAERLGGIDCATANPVVSLRAPWTLENWTLPVVELLMITGAVLGLAHAITMLRRHRQAAWLGLWVATIVYVLALEPFLYFPEEFGLDERVGLVFAHNVFSIEFLYDRLPLYIVALYPAGIYLAHLLVDRAGVFRRHGVLVGAVTTGVVHHAFYEVFDHIGPQLRWWAWNPDAAGTGPFFASVPLSSMVIFATVAPTLVVALARRILFVGAEDGSARPRWVGRAVVVGLLTPVLMPIASVPVGLIDADEQPGPAKAVFWVALGLLVAVGCWALSTSRPTAGRAQGFVSRYPLLHGGAFLLTFAVLWATALPDLLDADGRGHISDGSPIGSPFYAALCAMLCGWVLLRTARSPVEGAAHA